MRGGAALHRSPWSRFVYTRRARGAELFLAGQQYDASLALARRIERGTPIGAADWARLAAADRACLLALVNDGHFALSHD
jgi:hypothetical protein